MKHTAYQLMCIRMCKLEIALQGIAAYAQANKSTSRDPLGQIEIAARKALKGKKS